jgi:hypothetical protein
VRCGSEAQDELFCVGALVISRSLMFSDLKPIGDAVPGVSDRLSFGVHDFTGALARPTLVPAIAPPLRSPGPSLVVRHLERLREIPAMIHAGNFGKVEIRSHMDRTADQNRNATLGIVLSDSHPTPSEAEHASRYAFPSNVQVATSHSDSASMRALLYPASPREYLRGRHQRG